MEDKLEGKCSSVVLQLRNRWDFFVKVATAALNGSDRADLYKYKSSVEEEEGCD